MNDIDHLIRMLPLTLFWSAVLSFLPNALYLMTHPLESFRAEKARRKRIFILYQESQLDAEKKERLQTMGLIFSLCFVIAVGLYIFNWVQKDVPSLYPLDIVSTTLIIFFWISAIAYIPVLFYFLMMQPWKCKEEGVFLKSILVVYGIVMLIFSAYYASDWLQRQNISTSMSDFASSCMIVFYAAAALSYLPVLIYVLPRSSYKYTGHISLYTVFVIYCCCFLLFTLVYCIEWIYNKRTDFDFMSEYGSYHVIRA